MRDQRSVWREVAWIFLLNRLLFVILTFICVFVLPQFIPGWAQRLNINPKYMFQPYPLSTLFYSWLRWDAGAFLNISFQGYAHTPDVSFFPFWPLLQHIGGLILGGTFPISYYLAGLLLANACFYLALVFLYRLLAKDFGLKLARRAIFCLAFSPYAFFFFAGYSESLFLLLCCAFFLLLRRGRALDWWLAGIVGFCATLTRSAGIALAAPFLFMYAQQFWIGGKRTDYRLSEKLRALMPIVLIPAAVLAYMAYLWFTKGNALLFSTQQDAVWNRELTLPWVTLIMAVQAVFLSPSPLYLLLNVSDLVVVGLSLLILVLGWRHLPWYYSLFAAAVVIFTLCFPAHTVEPLMSQTRYMLILFPIAIMIAFWSQKPNFYRLYMGVTLVYLVITTILFIDNVWIA